MSVPGFPPPIVVRSHGRAFVAFAGGVAVLMLVAGACAAIARTHWTLALPPIALGAFMLLLMMRWVQEARITIDGEAGRVTIVRVRLLARCIERIALSDVVEARVATIEEANAERLVVALSGAKTWSFDGVSADVRDACAAITAELARTSAAKKSSSGVESDPRRAS